MSEKINLPIDQTKDDKVRPGRPDISWAGKMIIYCIAFAAITFGFFYGFSYFVVSNISIEREKELFGQFYVKDEMKKFDLSSLKTKVKKFEKYDIYINNDESINAFATPGANVFLNRGLLESAETEEEIIFIIAHEIAHIENRHILKRFSLQIPFTMTLGFLGIDVGSGMIDTKALIGNFFSRQDEKQADKGGIDMLNELGLNLKCATTFFEKMESMRQIETPEILSTHPSDSHRIERILKANKNRGKECSPYRLKEE